MYFFNITQIAFYIFQIQTQDLQTFFLYPFPNSV